jgi:hypothetical protein
MSQYIVRKVPMRSSRHFAALCSIALAFVTADAGAGPAQNASQNAPQSVELPVLQRSAADPVSTAPSSVPDVAYGSWRGTGYGAYLAPTNLDVAPDGGVDVMLHLNGAMMADKEWRQSGLNAIVASIAIREVVGSAGYAQLFAAPGYLDSVLRSTLNDLRRNGHPEALRVRRIGVVSWSAGMGGVGQMIRQERDAERIDSVVLLDSVHGSYANPKTGVGYVKKEGQAVMGLGIDWVNINGLSHYVRFATEAIKGNHLLVTSASAILPPDYASCTETSSAIIRAVGADTHEVETPVAEGVLGVRLKFHADKGDLHFRGYRGGGPRDHFDQLHLVGEVVRKFVAPRWNKLAADDRNQPAASR